MSGPFTSKVKKLISQIPKGKVASYGFIAASAGNPRAARQVARILHSCSAKDKLPWHRIVNRNGQISLNTDFHSDINRHITALIRQPIKFRQFCPKAMGH